MAYFAGESPERPWARYDWHKISISIVLVIVAFMLFFLAAKIPASLGKEQPEPISRADARAQLAPGLMYAEVLVARQPIGLGQPLEPGFFKKESRPINGIEKSVVYDPAAVENRYARVDIAPNNLLLQEHIAVDPPFNVLTRLIPVGYRAVAIGVDAESGVEGWARPGVRVDVAWTTTVRGRKLVTTIVENARVLSAGGMMNSKGEMAKMASHITLLVSIKDAQRIQLAKTSGSLTLNLRGEDDIEPVNDETVTFDGLLKPYNIRFDDEVQGTVTKDGKQYEVRGGRLVPPSRSDNQEPRANEPESRPAAAGERPAAARLPAVEQRGGFGMEKRAAARAGE